MGLFSSSGKDQQEAEDSGRYTARDDAELTAAARAKRPASAGEPAPRRKKNEAADPMLPEKKRARRRLVGAVALALAVAVGLPMLLDSEPRPPAGADIAIQIPSKDKAAPLPEPTSVPAGAALDPHEQIVSAASVAATPAPAAPAPAADKPARDTDPAAHAGTAQALARPAAKPPAKAEPAGADGKAVMPVDLHAAAVKEAAAKEAAMKEAAMKEAATKDAAMKAAAAKAAKLAGQPARPTADHAAPAKPDDAARALAILEGKAADAPAPAPHAGQFAAQVGAYATAEQVADVQGKLRAAHIPSFTEKYGKLTRVRVGPFASRAEAEQALARLDKLGLKGSMVSN